MDLKVLVSVKRVIDFNISIRVKSDFSQVETANVKMSMNPFDEIAIEEAIRLKEQGLVKELVAISIGPDGCAEILRSALAMGMDRAIHVKTDHLFEPINIAKILAYFAKKEQPKIIIMGKQAIDDDCNQTGQMLAAMLDWPQATFASKIIFNDQLIRVTREVDGGLETLELTLPAVITTDLRLNKPRYISLPNIIKSKQKSLDDIPLENLELNLFPHIKIKEVRPPNLKKITTLVQTPQELVRKLHEEAKVI